MYTWCPDLETPERNWSCAPPIESQEIEAKVVVSHSWCVGSGKITKRERHIHKRPLVCASSRVSPSCKWNQAL